MSRDLKYTLIEETTKPFIVAGVDEAGRGPLAGPVIAAAVILDPNKYIPGITDSKALSPQKREALFPLIKKHAICWAIGRAEVEEIDEINIFQASLLAMHRAILGLSVVPNHAQFDGTHSPKDLPCSAEPIIRGDQKVIAIGAASILAKVTRDHEMIMLDKIYPGYGFAKHKGYPTKEHRAAIRNLGACKIHRTSFNLNFE